MFRGSVKSTGYPLHLPVSPSLPLPASPCAITIQLESTCNDGNTFLLNVGQTATHYMTSCLSRVLQAAFLPCLLAAHFNDHAIIPKYIQLPAGSYSVSASEKKTPLTGLAHLLTSWVKNFFLLKQKLVLTASQAFTATIPRDTSSPTVRKCTTRFHILTPRNIVLPEKLTVPQFVNKC